MEVTVEPVVVDPVPDISKIAHKYGVNITAKLPVFTAYSSVSTNAWNDSGLQVLFRKDGIVFDKQLQNTGVQILKYNSSTGYANVYIPTDAIKRGLYAIIVELCDGTYNFQRVTTERDVKALPQQLLAFITAATMVSVASTHSSSTTITEDISKMSDRPRVMALGLGGVSDSSDIRVWDIFFTTYINNLTNPQITTASLRDIYLASIIGTTERLIELDRKEKLDQREKYLLSLLDNEGFRRHDAKKLVDDASTITNYVQRIATDEDAMNKNRAATTEIIIRLKPLVVLRSVLQLLDAFNQSTLQASTAVDMYNMATETVSSIWRDLQQAKQQIDASEEDSLRTVLRSFYDAVDNLSRKSEAAYIANTLDPRIGDEDLEQTFNKLVSVTTGSRKVAAQKFKKSLNESSTEEKRAIRLAREFIKHIATIGNWTYEDMFYLKTYHKKYAMDYAATNVDENNMETSVSIGERVKHHIDGGLYRIFLREQNLKQRNDLLRHNTTLTILLDRISEYAADTQTIKLDTAIVDSIKSDASFKELQQYFEALRTTAADTTYLARAIDLLGLVHTSGSVSGQSIHWPIVENSTSSHLSSIWSPDQLFTEILSHEKYLEYLKELEEMRPPPKPKQLPYTVKSLELSHLPRETTTYCYDALKTQWGYAVRKHDDMLERIGKAEQKIKAQIQALVDYPLNSKTATVAGAYALFKKMCYESTFTVSAKDMFFYVCRELLQPKAAAYGRLLPLANIHDVENRLLERSTWPVALHDRPDEVLADRQERLLLRAIVAKITSNFSNSTLNDTLGLFAQHVSDERASFNSTAAKDNHLTYFENLPTVTFTVIYDDVDRDNEIMHVEPEMLAQHVLFNRLISALLHWKPRQEVAEELFTWFKRGRCRWIVEEVSASRPSNYLPLGEIKTSAIIYPEKADDVNNDDDDDDDIFADVEITGIGSLLITLLRRLIFTESDVPIHKLVIDSDIAENARKNVARKVFDKSTKMTDIYGSTTSGFQPWTVDENKSFDLFSRILPPTTTTATSFQPRAPPGRC